MRILFCGPWFGEFGWEVVWQGFCRKIASSGKYDKIVACSFDSSEDFYRDFADEYIAHGLTGKSHIFYMTPDDKNISPSGCFNQMTSQIHRKFRNDHYKDDIDFYHPKLSSFVTEFATINMTGDHKKSGDYPLIPTDETLLDIIIHARKRKHVKYRNWEEQKWKEVVNELIKRGLSIACIGTDEAYSFPDVSDLRNVDLSLTRQAIRQSRVLLGPSSGPMVLGMCENTPIITWGPSVEEIPHVHLRYMDTWNFHGSYVKYIEDDNFDPSVEQVLEACDEFFSTQINKKKDH